MSRIILTRPAPRPLRPPRTLADLIPQTTPRTRVDPTTLAQQFELERACVTTAAEYRAAVRARSQALGTRAQRAPYTLEDYEAARAALAGWNEAFANDSSNNPHKYRSDIETAADNLETIKAELKSSGILEYTPQELLEQRLGKAFPNAQSRQTVEFEGKHYTLLFRPARKSRSGKTVTKWARWWEELK